MATRFSIEDMRAIAKQLGGKCLSKEYINSNHPLDWMCEKGHRWEADYQIIQQGGWCVQCTRNSDKDEKLSILQQVAKGKGGKCLSKKYTTIHTKLKWQCAQGHHWLAEPNQIKNRGHWCPYCAHTARRTIEEMRELAKERNGKCHSSKYENNKIKLKWQCADGHTWIARSDMIIRGAWCPYCAQTIMHTIADMRQLAKSLNGKCLSLKYLNNKTLLTWQCKEGHTWKAMPNNILNGQWCAQCYYKRAGNTLRANIKEFISIAKKRGGTLLSGKYINSATHLEWECRNGHTWKAIPNSIKRGRWCPYCAGKRKLEIANRKISVN